MISSTWEDMLRLYGNTTSFYTRDLCILRFRYLRGHGGSWNEYPLYIPRDGSSDFPCSMCIINTGKILNYEAIISTLLDLLQKRQEIPNELVPN